VAAAREQSVKIAYLILAHSQPQHLRRLIRAVCMPRARAFVHIDAKSDIGQFAEVCGSGATLCSERVAVYWGEFSLVEATLALLRTAMWHEWEFDYFVLLSGADYPLCPAAYIEHFFARHAGREFINLVAMPSERASKPLSRLTDYRVRSGNPWTLPTRVARRTLQHLRLLPNQRDFHRAFGELKPYAGSQWWALSREACQHVLNFVERERAVVDFFRNTWFPDEMLFQTILGNSIFRRRVARNVTYTDWGQGGAHPGVLHDGHLARFAAPLGVLADDVYGRGEVLFARKFNDSDAPLLARVDAIIEQKRQVLLDAAGWVASGGGA
jgi:hypothetical protein